MSRAVTTNRVGPPASRDGQVNTSTQLARRALAEFTGTPLLLIAV